MDFSKEKSKDSIGFYIGYIGMYFVFSTVLYFVLRFTGVLPEKWSVFYIYWLVVAGLIVVKLLRWGIER